MTGLRFATNSHAVYVHARISSNCHHTCDSYRFAWLYCHSAPSVIISKQNPLQNPCAACLLGLLCQPCLPALCLHSAMVTLLSAYSWCVSLACMLHIDGMTSCLQDDGGDPALLQGLLADICNTMISPMGEQCIGVTVTPEQSGQLSGLACFKTGFQAGVLGNTIDVPNTDQACISPGGLLYLRNSGKLVSIP